MYSHGECEGMRGEGLSKDAESVFLVWTGTIGDLAGMRPNPMDLRARRLVAAEVG